MGEQAPSVVPAPPYDFHKSKTPKGIVARYRKENNRLKKEVTMLITEKTSLKTRIEDLEAEILELKKEKFAGSLTICNNAGGITIT